MNIPLKNDNTALGYARTALKMMTERNIEPKPVNYAVWYHYAEGGNKELVAELDKLLQRKTTLITEDVTIFLYNKYLQIGEKTKENEVIATSQGAQNVLAGVMKVIEEFGKDTNTYSNQIDEHVGKLSQQFDDPAIQNMVHEIISRAVAIRDSGQQLTTKLEESRREIDTLKGHLEEVVNEANRDFLTGVGNRKALETKIEELTTWAKKGNSDLSLLMVDIDHFKKFNDTYGHLIGDEVLKVIARCLVDSVKGKDFVARYGGEEFAILLPNTPLAGALIVAEGIRKTVSESELVRKDTGGTIRGLSISIGVARYRTDVDNATMFISRADQALYKSKMGGRNRVTQESF